MFHFKKLLNVLSKYSRNISTQSINKLEKLEKRTIVSISGQDVDEYLQGLITNDINHLMHGAGSMYSMFLNTKGRVLYDVIIYKMNMDKSYLIECDKDCIESLIKHLNMYKVRRKVNISNEMNEYSVYALFNIDNLSQPKKQNDKCKRNLEGSIVPCTQLNNIFSDKYNSCKMYKDLAIFIDPRMTYLGNRIIASAKSQVQENLKDLYKFTCEKDNKNYEWLRYKLGVGEGVKDLPPGNCFPLECNCDYLHGVSFHKGCYIGQELTARTHHTGVVRKRLMPLNFIKKPTDFEDNMKITKDGVRLGVLRGVLEDVGVAVLKVAEVLEMKEIKVGNGIANTERPFWWPIEAPKEISVQKN